MEYLFFWLMHCAADKIDFAVCLSFSYFHLLMQRKKADVDVTRDVLQLMLAARPDSVFIRSLAFQYEERGGLSKKQLEGLYQKATAVGTIPDNKLATLEAIILKKPTRERAAASAPTPMFVKDDAAGTIIQAILEKYPQHKRILYFKAKFDNNEIISSADLTELKKFEKLLLR